jgi:S-adenosylmethionine:tRNA ribosyltransferase-isomerase
MMIADPPLKFTLPAELEATEPPEARGLRRDHVRLLVTSCNGERIVGARFDDLPRFLTTGDLLVANDSATLPAALRARRQDGTEIGLHLSVELPGRGWVVEPRLAEVAVGERLALPGGGTATLHRPYPDSRRLWIADLDLPVPVVDYLHRWGRPIAYSYVRGEWPLEAYQTVYAKEPGSAEMPSAGRAFSADVLERLAHVGVGFVTLTLHTGVASLEEHETPHPEPYFVPVDTAAAIRRTRAAGGRIIAVGTTVVRALESVVDDEGQVNADQGWTDLVITPERGVQAVDGLLTGFHEPKASHLAMLAALAGPEHLARAYRAAITGGYLWHEFGDLHLILP